MRQDELYHYGVKGMRWYQHIFGKDKGTSGAKTKKTKSQIERERKKKLRAARRKRRDMAKNPELYTRKQLEDLKKRMALEKEIQAMTKEQMKFGEKMVTRVIKDAGEQSATKLLKGVMTYLPSAAVAREFNRSDLANGMINGGNYDNKPIFGKKPEDDKKDDKKKGE